MADTIILEKIKQWHIENLPYQIIWMDQKGDLIYANKAFCAYWGYSSSEIPTLTIFDINPTVTEEIWRKHWDEVEAKGAANFKSVHQTKNRKFSDVEVSAQFFSNNRKKIVCAVVKDISETSFYTDILKNSLDATNTGGWYLNLQNGDIVVTDEILKIFEIEDAKEILPGNVIHRFQESDQLKRFLSDAIRKSKSYDEVLTLNLKDGRIKNIRCIADPVIKNKQPYKLIGTYQDVTEQYNREKGLAFFKKVIDSAQDLIYVYDRDGKLLHYSQSVKEKLGFSENQLSSFTIFDLDKKITREWWYEHFDDIKRKGSVHLEWEVSRRDGSSFPADIIANHLVYNGVDVNCAVVRDISVRKKYEIEIENALQELSELKDELEIDNQYLKKEISSTINLDNIICVSDAYREVLNQVTQVAITDSTVLITGESGTGKELLANAIHLNSIRSEKPFIKVNCATLPKDLIESELFGHKKGAFTGALSDKKGKFSLADGGTLFLDEIGELPIDLQSKLLRVLQEGEFDQLGSIKTTKVDVRIITATNRDLEEMIKEKTFREDLYYRLNVFPIHNIALRERKADIPALAQFFLEKYSKKVGKNFRRLSKKTIDLLMQYSFPGNIRELENLIERAVIIENGTTLNPGNWMPVVNGEIKSDSFKSLDESQRDYIIKVLNHTNWRVSGPKGAASILKMNDKTLFARMKKLGIEKQVGLKEK